MPVAAVQSESRERPAPEAPPILVPGRNCWRIDHARKLAFLIDGQDYFRAVRESIREARHSIFVLGWDVDTRMRLVPEGANDGWPEPFAEFLSALISARKGLRAFVLSWDFAMLYMLEREWMPLYKIDGRSQRRLSFRFDARHPTGASHHQKVVVVDDSVAFVSGMDITRSRWDSRDHGPDDPRRSNPFGIRYGPYHDVGAVVEGEAARTVGDLCRMRWERATGKPPRSRRNAFAEGRWPVSIKPDITDVPVAISRTEPQFENFAGVRELRELHLDAIKAARHHIFAENQYFTSRTITAAFAERLREPDAPDIAIVSPQMQSGWLEMSTMGLLRARAHRDLKASDVHGKYRLFSPKLPWLAEDQRCLNVHSKVLVVDDRFATVGSANLSDRSMGLDTECNLAIEARGDATIAAVITGLRARLLGEHLNCPPAAIDEALRTHGRLIAAIESLQRPGERTLATLDPPVDPTLETIVPDHSVLDPERPIDPDALVEDLVVEHEGRSGVRLRIAAVAGLVLIVGVAALAWRYTPLSEWLNINDVVRNAKGLTSHPLAVLLTIGGFVLGGFVLFPVTVMIGATVLAFGPVEGAIYSMAGALASAAATYCAGRTAGRDLVRRIAGKRLNALSKRLARRGVMAVTLVRMLPVAPFSVVNAVAGASHISWRDFLVGTLLGMLPGIALTAIFIDRAVAVAYDPGPFTVTVLTLVVVIAITFTWTLHRRLGQPPPSPLPKGEHVG